MASKKRGLSRGLDVLLKDTLGADTSVAVAVADAKSKTKAKVKTKKMLAESSSVKEKPAKSVLKKATKKAVSKKTSPIKKTAASKAAPNKAKPKQVAKSKVAKPASKKVASSKAEKPSKPKKQEVASSALKVKNEKPRQATELELEDSVVVEEPLDADEAVIKGLEFVDVTLLNPGRYQPRKEILESELETLADSIRTQGVLQPIVVKPPTSDGRYEIIAGERRFRASRLAGLKEVPAIIKDVSDEAAMAIALIENIQRENLNPVEEAEALERLAKTYDLSHGEVAEAVGKSRTSVTNLLRLLNLNDDVRLLLERGDIDMGHAKVLLGAHGHLQSTLARAVVGQNLSVRETEKLLARSQSNEPITSSKQEIDPDISRLQVSLSEKVGAPVKILHNNRGKGRVVIRYNSLDELDGILSHIQ